VTLGQWVTGQDMGRIGRYAELLAFYNGAQWSGRPRYGERRLTFNYARTFVRKVVSYLFGEPARWSVPGEGAAGDRGRAEAAEAALAEVAEANDLTRLDFDTAVDAAVLGDGAFKITWDPARRLPLVSPVDVQGLYCWWSPDDFRRLTRVVQVYRAPRGQGGEGSQGSGIRDWGANPSFPSHPLAPSELVVEDWRPDRYRVERGGQTVRDGPNPYPWLPFVVFPNEALPNEFWGVSDLSDLMPICQELNRRLSVLARILDLSGAPVAVLENVEGSDGVAVEPGAKWELPRDARAYLLDLLAGGGVELHIKAIEALYTTLHDIAETPRTAFGEGDGAISGVALEVQLQPLIQKVKRKRAIWEGVFRRRNAMILDLLALHGRECGTRRTATVWPPITPRDRPQLARDEALLVGAGIHSRQRAAERLGDADPAAEFAAVLAEAAALRAGQGA
jgi:SPP1 Gp6-like portal protein